MIVGARARKTRLVVTAAVIIVTAALLGGVTATLLRGSAYRLHARFADAGQLIDGAAVRIAGHKVGTVEQLRLTANGEVDATMRIDAGVTSLRRGTRAAIRATGQAGIASRYVALDPGPSSAGALPDGSVLSTAWTSGIVDLDAVLESFDASTRSSLRRLIAGGADLFAGSGAREFNVLLQRLDPAMSAVSAVSGDLSADTTALSRLVRDSATAATALAGRRRSIETAIDDSAVALGAVARRQRAFAEVLARAPSSLATAQRTLERVSATVTRLRPMLGDVPPVIGPLDRTLRQLTPALRASRPVLADLLSQLPDIRAALRGLVALASPAARALGALAAAAISALPIARGIRIYGVDFVLGVSNGLAGIITSNYNRTGHYGRLTFVENPQELVAGIPNGLLSNGPLIPGVLSSRYGVNALCPGGNEPPAPDGSNRVVVDRSLCDPSQGIPASVNKP